jgi:hypothetical protein
VLRDLLLATTILLGAATITMVLTTLIVLRHLHRRNRVAPSIRTNAPLAWLWSPGRAARLHRRLRAAVVHTRLGPDDPSATGPMVQALVAEAVQIDGHLVAVGRLRFADRQRYLRPLAADVARVEQVAARVARLRLEGARPLQLADHRRPLDELDAHCARVEEARRELQRIEAAAGIAT